MSSPRLHLSSPVPALKGQVPNLFEHDLSDMLKLSAQARQLTSIERAELLELTLPGRVDYSRHVTLVRNQDGCGGCGTMTAAAILDIHSELHRPFSPDSSYNFQQYLYNDSSYNHTDPRVSPASMNQLDVLQRIGSCSEATWPTNYDPPARPTDPPPDSAFAEAASYRIDSFSDVISKFTVDDLRRMIFKYGPLAVAGDVPGGAAHAHIFALVGYNDATRMFTLLNSWGDQWGNGGFLDLPYASVESQPSTQTTARIDWVRWVKQMTHPPTAHRFSGRIKVRTTTGRRYLSVAVGIEGLQPAVVWNHPARVAVVDNSLNLTYDFPLPEYAGQHWPPNERNRWFVEVADDSPGAAGTAATVDDVVLVETVPQPGGKFLPIIARPSGAHLAVQRGHSIKIYVPSRRRYTLSLIADRLQVNHGTTITLMGELKVGISIADSVNPSLPLAHQQVHVYSARHDQIEGTVIGPEIGCATTNDAGHFSVTYAPSGSGDYQAVVTRPDTTVLALSGIAHVDVV